MSRDRDQESRSLGAGALAAISGSAAFAIFEFVLALFVTRGLGAAEAGVFFSVMALFMIAMSVLMLGPSQGLIRHVAHAVALSRPADVRHLVWLGLLPTTAVATLFAIGALIAAPSISELIVDGEGAVPYLRATAPLLPLAVAMNLLLAATRGLGTMRPTVLLDRLGVGGSRPVLVGFALITGGGAVTIGLAWALPYGVAALIAAAWLARMLTMLERGEDRGPRARRVLGRELWAFSSVRGGAAAMEIATRWLDIPLVAALASAEAAGIYAAVSRLALAGTVPLRGVMLAFGPRISALIARDDLDGARHAYRLATNWTVALGLPVYLLVIGYPGPLLDWFGSGFGAGSTALVIISCALLSSTLVGPIALVLLMEGKTWLNAFNATVATLINVGLNVWLIPELGIEGAALAWAASIVFANAAPLVQLRRSGGYQPVGPGWLVLVAVGACSLAAIGIGLPALLGLSQAAGVAVYVLVALPLYGGLVYRWRRPTGIEALIWSVRRGRMGTAEVPTAPEP